ncbi:MAG: monovalent cation/H+ antiporter complex subunit F [Planctomycetota bacterium]
MSWPLMWITQIGVIVLVLGVVLCLWRMIKGPHLADRVLAGDTVAMLVAGLVVVLAIKFDSALFFDAALVVAILGFVSTVAFAQYIGAKNKSAPEPGGETEEQGL